jgi:hypothetical protein
MRAATDTAAIPEIMIDPGAGQEGQATQEIRLCRKKSPYANDVEPASEIYSGVFGSPRRAR